MPRCVLVIGADFMSRVTDPDDRSTAAVFADGAGAVVLERTEHAGRIGPVILGSDGAGADHIRVGRAEGLIRMRGHETFREAVARLRLSTLQAAKAADVALDEIDLFVYHQANGRILVAVGERLGLRADRVVDCIAEYGNTSAATLPLALAFSERAACCGRRPGAARRVRRRLHLGCHRDPVGAADEPPLAPRIDERGPPLERLERLCDRVRCD